MKLTDWEGGVFTVKALLVLLPERNIDRLAKASFNIFFSSSNMSEGIGNVELCFSEGEEGF
jgi:hypothetical protein